MSQAVATITSSALTIEVNEERLARGTNGDIACPVLVAAFVSEGFRLALIIAKLVCRRVVCDRSDMRALQENSVPRIISSVLCDKPR